MPRNFDLLASCLLVMDVALLYVVVRLTLGLSFRGRKWTRYSVGALVVLLTIGYLLWRRPIVRYCDPLTLCIGLIDAALLWVVMRLTRGLSSRGRKRIRYPFVALVVVFTGVYLFWPAPADADAQVGLMTQIDDQGNPVFRNGRVVQFTGRPTEPGNYRVSLGNRRFFVLHLPEGYRDDPQEDLLPTLSLLHGDHQESAIEWALADCQMNGYADRDRFIGVYPAAQPLYTIFGQPYHSWNSRLGTLSKFDSRFEDDAEYLDRVHKWVLANTRADPDNFNLGGFSGGVPMAMNAVQLGAVRFNCFIAIAGTMLEGQQLRHLNGRGPNHVLIQINTRDTVLPFNTNNPDQVVPGAHHWRNTRLLGYVNLDKSKPGRQPSYWEKELLAGGKSVFSAEENAVYTRSTVVTQLPDGQVKEVTVYEVDGGHAWHGNPEGGDDEEPFPPRMDFSLADLIAQFIREHKATPRGR